MKNINTLGPDLHKLAEAAKQKLKDILPKVVSVEGQRHFEESWDSQGFTDKSLKKWAKRKFSGKQRRNDGKLTKAFSEFQRKDKGRALLVSHQGDKKGTHLKDTIKATADEIEVVFSTDKVYAEGHNEGGHAGRGKGFEMPKRQFMGPSEELNQAIEKKINKTMEQFFRNFSP